MESRSIQTDATGIYPLWMAPFLNDQHAFHPFPAIYLKSDQVLIDLRTYLEDRLSDFFPESESMQTILDQVIPRCQDAIEHGHDSYNHLIRLVFKSIAEVLDSKDSTKLNELENNLLSVDAMAIGFSHLASFQILDIQLRKREYLHTAFLKRIKACISGLNDLLHLHGKDDAKEDHHYGFAEDLISFDRIADIQAPVVSSDLPANRMARIEYSLKVLQSALQTYESHSSVVITSGELASAFDMKHILSHALIMVSKKIATEEARRYVNIEIESFTATIAAIKLAELEISQKYDELLHYSYFEAFDSSFLGEEDLKYLRPVIIIERSHTLIRHSQDLLSLISGHANIKVMGLYFASDEKKAAYALDSDMALELASLAITRRNAFIFQGSIASPALWYAAIEKSLEATRPALWHILMPDEAPTTNSDLLRLRAATECRYFPNIVYDTGIGEAFGSHFDISVNPQSENTFPEFQMEIMTTSEKESRKFKFTIADYIGALPEFRSKLYSVPSEYDGDYLVEITEYLFSTPEAIADKLPFIWTVDEEENLMKAVVPLSWIQLCRSRIEYWHFLQELGGTNNYHVHHALEAARKKWNQIKEEEIAVLKNELQAEFDKVRSKDLERAIKRMLNMLLNTDNGIKLPFEQPENDLVSTDPQVQTTPSEAAVESSSSEPEVIEISSEAWVESDECTSCNDCTEALPGVFKYNDDKQAYVHNPKGGSFAKIVAAAEKCPAACIHPGLPHDERRA